MLVRAHVAHAHLASVAVLERFDVRELFLVVQLARRKVGRCGLLIVLVEMLLVVKLLVTLLCDL